MALLKHGEIKSNRASGGVGHLVWYYNLHEINQGIKLDGEEYASVTNTCKYCNKEYNVYRYDGCRWSKIKFCSKECCWQYTYGRSFLEGKENAAALRHKAYKRSYKKHRDARLAGQKRYRETNKEKIRAYDKEYKKKYVEEHREEINAKARERYHQKRLLMKKSMN